MRAEAGGRADHRTEVAGVGDRVERDDAAAARRPRRPASSRSSGWAYSYGRHLRREPLVHGAVGQPVELGARHLEQRDAAVGGDPERPRAAARRARRPRRRTRALTGMLGPQRLDDRVAAGDPLGVAGLRRCRGRLLRAGAVLVACARGLLGGRRPVSPRVSRPPCGVGPLPSQTSLTHPAAGCPRSGCPSLGLRDVARRGAASCRPSGDASASQRPRGPCGVSSTSMPAALSGRGSRPRSRSPWRARAAARCSSSTRDQRVDRRGQPASVVRGAAARPSAGRTGRGRARASIARTDDAAAAQRGGCRRRRAACCPRGPRRRSPRPRPACRGRRPSRARSSGTASPSSTGPPSSSTARSRKSSIRAKPAAASSSASTRTRRASGSARRRCRTAGRSPRTRSSTAGTTRRVAERLAHLLAGGGDPGVVHPVRRERRTRPRATGPARSRGAGSAGRRRRRGCRSRRRGTSAPSPSTRCASRAVPGPTARATPRSPAPSPASGPSRARSRAGRACPRGSASSAASMSSMPLARSARRSPARTARRSTRRPSRPRRRRRGRARSAARSARASPARARWPPARRSGGATLSASYAASSSRSHRVGEVVPGAALLGGLDEDLVVDVGDVADQRDVVAASGQPAPQHVEVRPPTGRARRAARTAP